MDDNEVKSLRQEITKIEERFKREDKGKSAPDYTATMFTIAKEILIKNKKQYPIISWKEIIGKTIASANSDIISFIDGGYIELGNDEEYGITIYENFNFGGMMPDEALKEYYENLLPFKKALDKIDSQKKLAKLKTVKEETEEQIKKVEEELSKS